MRFYIFSFILHIILIFGTAKFFDEDLQPKNKRIVVYLSGLEVEGKGDNPAPLPKIAKEEKKAIEKIETVKNKKEGNKIQKHIKSKNNSQNTNVTSEKIKNKNLNYLKGLVKDGTGTYIGDIKISQGIGYKVIREVNPIYPEMATKMAFKDEVVIQTKFLVGLDGSIEEIVFLDNFTKYGFHKEVEKALKKWKFEPIIYHGKNIKMYFYKDFRFNLK